MYCAQSDSAGLFIDLMIQLGEHLSWVWNSMQVEKEP